MRASVEEQLAQGPATSRELQLATGLSQSSVSRQLRALGDFVVRLGRGRTTRYLLGRNAFGASNRLPLHQVDPHGNHVLVAWVLPLAHGGFAVAPTTGSSRVLAGANGDGLFDDLPYFLDDLRPQGFLGRQIAPELAARDTRFPDNPARWTSEHVGRYLVANGGDLPGNLILGEPLHLRLRNRPVAVTEADYPALAEAVLAGEIPGSSAGGEQAKFTAYRADRGHVIVKFSPRGDDAASRRWRDILISEHIAAELLYRARLPAAETRLFEIGGRLFLESVRFDRHREYGRLPMISLQAVDAEFCGLGSDWPAVMDRLVEQGLVSGEHALDARVLWAFGRLINNTDMHLGNLSLGIEGDVFRLLPAYDMCAMGFAPKAGEVRPLAFEFPDTRRFGLGADVCDRLRALAGSFWRRMQEDERVSAELRAFLTANRFWAEQAEGEQS